LLTEAGLIEILTSKEYKAFFDKNINLLRNALLSNHIGDSEFALAPDEEEYDAKGQSTLNEIQTLQN